MEQKYRTLEVGEPLIEGDEYRDGDRWCLTEEAGIGVAEILEYRRPVSEVNIHGSSENSTGKVVPQQYRDLTFDDFIQPGDEVWSFNTGPWGPVLASEYGQHYSDNYWRIRRPVATEEPVLNGCGVAAEEDAQPQTVASISTELAEVREAWLKDHMEMKRKLDAMDAEAVRYENMWTEQCNHVRKLKRELEDALSDKVIAEKSYREARVERDELLAKHAMHHNEAERLSLENEELCAARYQLNTIKQAFQFIKES